MDQDLLSLQEARDLVRRARSAQHHYKTFTQEQVDRVVAAMAEAGAAEAARLGQLACEETGFGRPDSKRLKNLFATRTLHERMAGMKTVGVIRKLENDTIWEIATPMGVVAALIPSTNPTSTAMYKAIIAAKARCGIVMSPHPRARRCTAEALRIVAEAAYAAGAPQGLFGCMTEVSIPGTNALLEHPDVDVILATGGTPMVRAAYSKGKPAYGVGSGNVPVYVDRSADLEKAAADLLYGASFDWGTLCSTERSVVADAPIRTKLIAAMKAQGAFFLNEEQKAALRRILLKDGHLNVDQVGQSPQRIAALAGFSVPEGTRALVAEVEKVGREEPLSMETLSPILSFYTADGWQAGCARCIEVLSFGGIGHTLGLHCGNPRVIEAFALEKPAMRIVVNTTAALGSVGYTNRLFPAMTLGPGTLGGSITSDNISPMHLLNVKRLAFETDPLHPPKNGALKEGRAQPEAPKREAVRRDAPAGGAPRAEGRGRAGRGAPAGGWMEEIEARLLARAGNAPAAAASARPTPGPAAAPASPPAASPKAPSGEASAAASAAPSAAAPAGAPGAGVLPMPEEQIEALIRRFRK